MGATEIAVRQHAKSIVGAISGGILAMAGVASQIDFTNFTYNNGRDLIIAFIVAALGTGGAVYQTRNTPSI